MLTDAGYCRQGCVDVCVILRMDIKMEAPLQPHLHLMKRLSVVIERDVGMSPHVDTHHNIHMEYNADYIMM